MAQVLIRNLDDSVVERLKRRAASNGRSLQAELHELVEQAARVEPAAARRLADRIRGDLPRPATDSTELLRELRGG
jgi:plasmid stability protein